MTKTSPIRALWMASVVMTPLLLGADGGGCSAEKVPIGGDRADAGSSTAGGSSTGGGSSSTAGASSTGGGSSSTAGASSTGGGSSSTAGASSAGGGSSSSGGSGAELECVGERQALLDFMEMNKACSSDDDCQTQFVGCGVSEDDCTGAVYLNEDTDLSAFDPVRAAFVGCTTDGGVACAACLRIAAAPACISGRCQRSGSEADCSSQRAALVEFIEANKACEVDDDCTARQVGCDVTEDDCTGAVIMSRDTDFSAFERLQEAFVSCEAGPEGGCAVCDRAFGGGSCEAGRCVGRHPLEAEICGLPVVTGPCNAAFPRYAYDGSQCVPFTYGGCQGNANNFETLEACEQACNK